MTNYDSGQMTQNLLMLNPGFEGQIWNSTIRCLSGTATSCVDEDQWSGWPAGFWDGATFEVFYGTAAGRTGSVSTSTAPANGQGVTLNFANSGVAPSAGDYLIVRKTVPGGSTGGWWPTTTGSGQITDNQSDLPPGTFGKQTIALSAPGASDSANVAGYFDSLSGKTFVQLNGTYRIQFKAKGTGGSNQILVKLNRGGSALYFNQTVTLSNSWNTYSQTFTAAENGSAVGTVGLSFGTVGADSFELDDVSVGKINGDATNTTAFRDPVVNALRALQPGVLRYWAGGGQLGETLDNLIVPVFGRQRAGFSAWVTESDQVSYGLQDFLALCQSVGAEPWFVVPTTFSTTDASNLIEYLGGGASTPYGAKRAALGQSVPWTQVFSKIHLEFGNEAWNPTFKGGSIEYSPPYGSRSQTIFGVMRANASFVTAGFDLVIGGQAVYPGRNTEIQNNCNNNDSFALAPYTMNQVDSYTDNESLFGSTFAESEAFISRSGTAEGLTPGMVYQDYQAIQASSHPVPLSFYEVNLSTLAGGITQQALNGYTSSLGAGLAVADTMLLSLRQFGVVNQELFSLPQYSFNRPDGKSVFLWGSVVDMGVTDRKRPQFLALQLANQALTNGSAMLQTVHTGADPTWNQPLVNTVQLDGAHYLHSFAFSQGMNRSAIVFNFSRSGALPVTFSGTGAPSGAVQMQQLTSANPTDTNENANVVNTVTSTLSGFNPASGLSLPPYSMTVLTWSVGSSIDPAPVISTVATSGISSTSAMITWTTDQPASSQVLYGPTSSYGSASTLNSTLTTTHSVTLSDLTAASTYDYQVVSSAAGGSTAASPNFTFSTPPAPAGPPVHKGSGPKVGNVAFWGITGSGVTISWSTDVPATTAVGYGTTSALGQMATNQTALSNSHGLTLSGLTDATTYYFVAQSTDAKGNTGFSTPYTFTTLNTTGPVISGINAVPVTGNTATISWQTSTPATSYVTFGPTTAYGRWSAVTSLTQYPKPDMGWVPSGVIHYQLHSMDALGLETDSPDYTMIEP